MNIIIPMAGWGTRLRPHTLTVPKPMLSVAGKPIVEHLVNDLVRCVDEKIENVVFIIRSDFGKKIEEQLMRIAESINVKGHIRYQEEPLGTAHAICVQAISLTIKSSLDLQIHFSKWISILTPTKRVSFSCKSCRSISIWSCEIECRMVLLPILSKSQKILCLI
jgi:hypothetical protein